MSLFDKSTPPSMESMRVCPPGTLVHVKMHTPNPVVSLVLETRRKWGNPNGDNTADHWYFTYLLYEEDGDHLEVQARYYREFVA